MMGRQDEPEQLFYAFRLESHVARQIPKPVEIAETAAQTRRIWPPSCRTPSGQ